MNLEWFDGLEDVAVFEMRWWSMCVLDIEVWAMRCEVPHV